MMQDNSKKRSSAASKAKLAKMIATVEEHFHSRLFLTEMPIEDQIEHLSLEVILRDALVTAKHFADRADALKNDLKAKEVYLYAKKHGLLAEQPKSIRLYQEEKFKSNRSIDGIPALTLPEDTEDKEDMDGVASTEPQFAGPPDLRPRHIYCPKRFEVKRTEHGNSHAAYASILEVGLPVRHCYRLSEARALLLDEFRYAKNVVDCIFTPLGRRQTVGTVIDPILIWGKPGLGKSRLARKVCERLGLHSELVSVAGMAEDFLFGVPLGFGSAKASIVTEGVRKSLSANPVIVLDEVDKIADNRRFGSIYDRLLAHLEKSEASSMFDPFLNCHVDCSKVGWILTANTIAGIPAPLLSRLRVVELKAPNTSDLKPLIEVSRKEIAAEDGLDPRWLPSFSQEELDLLYRAFDQHKSLRVLRRQIEVVLSTRPACIQ